MTNLKQVLAVVLSFLITVPTFAATQNTQTAPATPGPSAQEMQQLVAPIALYPDQLVAQVLAGSTYPTQIVELERWLGQNKNLKGDQLVAAVDQQAWDPSIKALSQFPSVVTNMNQNLSWTSALGDAYFNDPSSVMTAIQMLRREAQQAGNLNSSPQQTVTTDGQTIIIEPANPEVVYLPSYSPAVVYGTAIEPYPGYSGWGVAAASAISFGTGIALGAAFGSPWGWGGWGANWHGGSVTYNRNNYVSHSNTFANRNTYNQANRAGNVNRNAANLNRNAANFNQNGSARNFSQSNNGMRNAGTQAGQTNLANRDRNLSADRGYGNANRSSMGTSGAAFSGYREGGAARTDSSRGSSSFSGSRGGGGGASRGGGGGGRGGGGGGGRR